MAKGNSGLQSKHQVKLDFTEIGIIGDSNGYEVFTEVVMRFRVKNAKPENITRVCGRTSNDTKWYEIGQIRGVGSEAFHVASWDYVMYESLVYSSASTENTIIASAFFNDGMFITDAIKDMSNEVTRRLEEIDSNVCEINKEINVINRQIEIITDHEEHEVK